MLDIIAIKRVPFLLIGHTEELLLIPPLIALLGVFLH